MSIIKFKSCGAWIDYELANNGKREELRINDVLIVDCWGDVGAWGSDYHLAIAGLHGSAKTSVESAYLKRRAEALLIGEIFNLREQLKEGTE